MTEGEFEEPAFEISEAQENVETRADEFDAADPGSVFQNDTSWSDFQLSRPILRALSDTGFYQPTIVQAKVIPSAIKGLDILAQAPTGTGKTAAFLVPIIERLCRSPYVAFRSKGKGKYTSKALILLPTRELAHQCYEMLENLLKYLPHIGKVLVAGGMTMTAQELSLRRRPDIVVGTPGRTIDLLLNGTGIDVDAIEMLVFDEADRLLDSGFKAQALELLGRLKNTRQTLLLSATLDEGTKEFSKLALTDPVKVYVTHESLAIHKINEDEEDFKCPGIVEEFYRISDHGLKNGFLMKILNQENVFGDPAERPRVVVFFKMKKDVHKAKCILKALGYENMVELHGDLTQPERLINYKGFASGVANLLLSSDVAARGLDMKDVDIVINRDMPQEFSRYVHRVGRTARMNRRGRCISVYTDTQRTLAKQCAKAMKKRCLSSSWKKVKKEDKSVLSWVKKLEGLEETIKDMLEEEKIDKEISLVELQEKKTEALVKGARMVKNHEQRDWIEHLNKSTPGGGKQKKKFRFSS
eukprot:GHVP01033976.1.p2 GENE.GHVP01033976.1~~GHVP01033976.1.p2  ORF type:complete len:528 (+),score=108.48 GHVP01033976.1:3464-5047(+)